MPAHGILFTVAVEPLAVFITLVGGDHHDGAGMPAAADGFQEVDGPEDVGGEGFHGDLIREPDERLGREVENELRLLLRDDAGQSGKVCQIASVVGGQARGDAELIVEHFVRLRVQGIAGEPGSGLEEPQRQPGALESGVPREQNGLACVGGVEHW